MLKQGKNFPIVLSSRCLAISPFYPCSFADAFLFRRKSRTRSVGFGKTLCRKATRFIRFISPQIKKPASLSARTTRFCGRKTAAFAGKSKARRVMSLSPAYSLKIRKTRLLSARAARFFRLTMAETVGGAAQSKRKIIYTV